MTDTRPRPGRLATVRRHPATLVLVAWAATQLCLLLSGPLVVRLLGVEDRGELAMIFAVVLVCCQFGLVGLPAAVMYVTSRERVSAWSVLRAVRGRFLGQVAAAAAVAMIAAALMSYYGHDLSYPVTETLLVGVGVTVTMGALVTQGGLQGQHQFRVLALVTPLPSFLYAVALVAFLLTDLTLLPAVLGALLAGWLAAALIGTRLLRRTQTSAPAYANGAGPVLRYGRRAAIATAAPTDQLGVDQLLVGAILGHASLGLYVIGAAFQSVTLLPLVSLASFVGPRIASTQLERRVRESRKWLLTGASLGLVTCLLILVLAPVVVPLAFGAEARAAVPAARVLAVAGLLLGLRRLSSVVLQAVGAPGRSAGAEVLSFVTMVTGVSALSVTHGVLGGCFGVVIAGAVATTAQLLTLRRIGRQVRSGVFVPSSS